MREEARKHYLRVPERRQCHIFNSFYSLSSYEWQKDFVWSQVRRKGTDCILVHTSIWLEKRDQSLSWCIQATWLQRNGRYTNASPLLLVVPAYLSASPCARRTLAIGHGYVQHALSNTWDRQFTGEDGRGKQSSFNRIPDNAGDKARKHSESFPAVESHYCRKQASKKYLDSNLSVNQMHRLYVEKFEEASEPPLTRSFSSMLRNLKRLVNHHSPDLSPLC